ncbi:hypothetical protein Tco_1429101 [Tanacetum coccineum]
MGINLNATSLANLVMLDFIHKPPFVKNRSKTNDGFPNEGNKKEEEREVQVLLNGGQLAGPSVKQNLRYESRRLQVPPKKGDTKVEEDDVQNVYDESANLLQNIKAGGSSSFTVAVG